MKNVNRILTLTLATAMAYTADAAGTTAGTNITNQASVDYVVGGVNQTDVNSNIEDFEVDRKVIFTVTADAASEDVIPGETGQVLTFTVSNASNDVLDFSLAASAFSGNDVASSSSFVESGATAGYQVGEDTATYIDELAADSSKKVHIVSTIAAAPTAAHGDSTVMYMTVTSRAGGAAGSQGAVLTETGAPDVKLSVENVFADAAGVNDAGNDGIHSDDASYNVVSAALTITKSTSIISDPINGAGANRKRIPGAVIEYTISIQNTGGAAADNVDVTDALDANVTYSAGTIIVDGVAEDDNATGGDESDPNGADYDNAGNGTINALIGQVAAAATKTVVYRVTVD